MSDDAKKLSDDTHTNDDRFAATRLFEPENSLNRQEEDIALAAELMNSGLVTDREVTAAVSDWSIHGSVPLAQHLEDKGILTAEQADNLSQNAKRRVDRARRSIAASSELPTGTQSMLLATLERLDGSGRVAKLLGVTVAARGGDDDARVMQGRYELVRKLGQGGLGRVWLARDANLNRHVALKEISHAAGASEAIVERFRNEAEITGRLDHPSIVPIYQLGEDLETGRVFYTMRFLGRSTLQDSISEYHERREEGNDDPMLLRQLLTAFVNVCHAIGHAHSRKVIHRDLKPENVVIDSFGQVIVIDWGLAKVIDDTSVESLADSIGVGNADRTSEGQVLGTPLFMAPEQAAGRLDELDHRTDIYGLGAILFAIVTGFAPHEKTQKHAVDSGIGARGMISVIAGGVTPQARDVNSEVDAALEAICSKAMARRRYARYQQASELAQDVQRWMAGELVSAFEEGPWQRTHRWIAKHPRLSQSLLALAMIVLVAATTLGVSARHNHVAEMQSKFSQMSGDVRGVEMQLRRVAAELAKDARFLAALPPVEGIIAARNGIEGDDEQVWRSRLASIFSGMLRSNPDFLALSFEARNGEGVKDIVRVERNPADPTLVRELPESRLKSIENSPLMVEVAALEPGDVKQTLDVRPRHADSLASFDRMCAATPVFDQATSDCFGMIVIETQVSALIEQIILGLGRVDCDLYVADGRGQLWVSALREHGVRVASEGETISDLPAIVESSLASSKEPFELQQGEQFIARRFYIASSRGVLIFARLPRE